MDLLFVVRRWNGFKHSLSDLRYGEAETLYKILKIANEKSHYRNGHLSIWEFTLVIELPGDYQG